MTCLECGEELETTRGAAFEIIGFEEVRKDGGTNHVLWRKRTERVLCARCVFSKKYGSPDPNQLSLV